MNLTTIQTTVRNFSKYSYSKNKTLDNIFLKTFDIYHSKFANLTNLYTCRN